MPVFDVHTHIFPPEIIRDRQVIAARDRGFSVIYGDPRARMADEHDLRRYMAGGEIERAVVVSFPFKDTGLITLANDYILNVASSDPRITPFAAVNVELEADALSEVDRCVRRGARGVGEIAFYGGAFAKRERKMLEPVAALLEERNAALMLHLNEPLGHTYPGKTDADFREVEAFVSAHPDLRIILAHMGGGVCFYEFMPEVRERFSRVYYDLAATPFLYSSQLYVFAARFLSGKVLFGSDFPLLSLERYAKAMSELSEAERSDLLYGNARGFFEDDRLG